MNTNPVVTTTAELLALAPTGGQNRRVTVERLGFIDYQSAWDYQEQLLAATVATKTQNRQATETNLPPRAHAQLPVALPASSRVYVGQKR